MVLTRGCIKMSVKEKVSPVAFKPTLKVNNGLERAKEILGRSKSYCINQALELYLDELVDYEVALKRLHDPKDKTISWNEVWKRLKDEK
jgi:predicted DNA-binding protein